MKKTLALVLLSVLAVAAVSAKTLRVGMIHWIAYSPLNVADTNGYWKDLGLDVKVINFGSNQELNAALENKKIDVALDMLGSWVGMYQQGIPLTILMETDWSNGGDKIIAKKGLDLATIKGSTIGVYLNLPSVTYFLSKFLESKKMKFADFKVVEIEPEGMANAFIADKFKLIVNYDPQALRAEKDGKGAVVATSATYPGVIPEGFVTRKDTLATLSADDLAKLFTGWFKAVDWAADAKNFAAYKKILNAQTFEGEAPYSDADLKSMIASVKIHTKAESLARNKTGGGAYTYFKELNDFLLANKLSAKAFAPTDIFDNTAILKALK